MADVVALIDDLFFQAKLTETARQVGVTVQLAASGEAFLAAAGAGVASPPPAQAPRLLLVDLNARSGPLEALEALRARGNHLPVIGFLSHVQVELAERARAAGCEAVLPRSKFTAELAAILARAKPRQSKS